MSVVWRGYDEVLGRRVAVKVLAAEFATDADFRSRIRREAQAAARLSDPHITNVYDYGEARDGTPFVVMELVDGPSLAERLASGPLSAESIAAIGAGVAAALAVAHAHGLVHRDIKPANVMLSPSGVKVVDFGISALAGEHGGPVLGTPGYLAPEQQAGAPAAPAADVYALGLLLSLGLDHRTPVPAELSALIAECLSRDPVGRPSSSSVAARLAAVTGAARAAGRAPAPPESRRTPPRYGAPAPGPVHRSGTRIMPPPPPVPPRLRRPRRWPFVAAAAVLVFVACLAGASLVKRHTGSSAAASMPARSATPSPSPSPRPSPSPSLGCRVDYHVTDYGIGFQAQLTLTNSGSADISSWTLAFDFPDDQKLSVGWGGVWKQDGSRVTVRDILLNGSMKPGKSVEIGFVGTYRGKNDEPQQFSLNDVSCGRSDG
jgi:serine/threonine-protein kinase